MQFPTGLPSRLIKICLALVITMSAAIAFAGQQSTIFSYDGQDFVRVDTTLMTADGDSAVNTKLNRNDPSYMALVQKRSFTGAATVNGQTFDAYYAPLTDENGQLTGAIFVGKTK